MCIFCEGDCILHDNSLEISIVDGWLRVRKYRPVLNVDEQTNFLINYCPMCGKKLEE